MLLTTISHELFVARYLAAKDATLGTELDLTSQGDWAQKPVEDLSNGYLGAFDIHTEGIWTPQTKANGLAFSFFGADTADDVSSGNCSPGVP